MTGSVRRGSSPFTGVRVALLSVLWVAVVYLIASPLGLYYERLAAWYTVPVLGLTYAYCVSHRRRATTILAVVATLAAILVIGLSLVIPKGSAA